MRDLNRPVSRLLRTSIGTLLLLAVAAAPALAAGEGGLEIFPDPRRLLLLIAGFVLLIYPVNALLLRPLLRVLDERQVRIEGTRERAREIQQEADAILDRYRSLVRSAREETAAERRTRVEAARREELEATAAARADADRQISDGRRRVVLALDEARGELRGNAEILAREAAQRVLGRALS